jgi:hypothetical protein
MLAVAAQNIYRDTNSKPFYICTTAILYIKNPYKGTVPLAPE